MRFAADPRIVGRIVHLNGVAATIIGVTPHDFTGTGVSARLFGCLWGIEPLINADHEWLRQTDHRRYRLCGRLAPGVTTAQAAAQITVLANHLRALRQTRRESALSTSGLVWPGSPFPLPLSHYGGLNLAILLIMLGAAMVLAVASANVGSLQLARARSRETELRTRLSLGATRARVMRQLLTENALLGVRSSLIALLISWTSLKIAVKTFTDAMPVEFGGLVFDVNPDLSVFVHALLISVVAGIASELIPAIQSPRSALTSTARATTASVRGRWLQEVLVAVQVGFSLVRMVTGSMFVRGAINSSEWKQGTTASRWCRWNFSFPRMRSTTRIAESPSSTNSATRVAALTGVTRVTSGRPPGSSGFRTAAIPIGEVTQTAPAQSILYYTYVQADYFETLGIRLSLGGSFERRTHNRRSVVLSESAAKRIFGSKSPLGRNIRLGLTDERVHDHSKLIADGSSYEAVGIVHDTRGSEFDGSDSKQVYLPLRDDQLDSRLLLVRLQSNPVQLLLALTGIFGTVSHIVGLRTREVGIRMALGAQHYDVLRLILRESTQPVLAGLALGLVVAAAVVYLLREYATALTLLPRSTSCPSRSPSS